MREIVADLIRGTSMENDERELTRLRELPPKEQVEVSIVLRTAMMQGEESPKVQNERLARVRSVEDARRFLSEGPSG